MRLLWQPLLAAVPRHAVEAAAAAWPARIVDKPRATTFRAGHSGYRNGGSSNGRAPSQPAILGSRSVAMDELVFLPIANGITNVNLYKAGQMQSMNPRLVPPLFIPALRRKRISRLQARFAHLAIPSMSRSRRSIA